MLFVRAVGWAAKRLEWPVHEDSLRLFLSPWSVLSTELVPCLDSFALGSPHFESCRKALCFPIDDT